MKFLTQFNQDIRTNITLVLENTTLNEILLSYILYLQSINNTTLLSLIQTHSDLFHYPPKNTSFNYSTHYNIPPANIINEYFYYSCHYNRYALVKFLLHHKDLFQININYRETISLKTPLMGSLNNDLTIYPKAHKLQLKVITLLLSDTNLDINLTNKYGMTALHITAYYHDPIVLHHILSSYPHYIDLTIRNIDNMTAIERAKLYNDDNYSNIFDEYQKKYMSTYIALNIH